VAPLVLVAASVVALLGPGDPGAWTWGALVLVVVLAVVALLGRARVPFLAAIAIAAVDVAALVLG
jgi:hypothetical protein